MNAGKLFKVVEFGSKTLQLGAASGSANIAASSGSTTSRDSMFCMWISRKHEANHPQIGQPFWRDTFSYLLQ